MFLKRSITLGALIFLCSQNHWYTAQDGCLLHSNHSNAIVVPLIPASLLRITPVVSVQSSKTQRIDRRNSILAPQNIITYLSGDICLLLTTSPIIKGKLYPRAIITPTGVGAPETCLFNEHAGYVLPYTSVSRIRGACNPNPSCRVAVPISDAVMQSRAICSSWMAGHVHVDWLIMWINSCILCSAMM